MTVHFYQDQEPCRTFYPCTCTHSRAIAGSHDEVSFPMPRHESIFDLGWPKMNTDQVWDLMAAILTAITWAPLALALPKASNELLFSELRGIT